MKLIILSSLLLFAQLKSSSRLILQSIAIGNSCTNKYQCLNPIKHTCETVVRCFANPCSINNGGCASDQLCFANYCGGCNAVCEGDSCGASGTHCDAMKCPCGLCPDGVNNYGCCGTCTMESDGNDGLQCSGYIPEERACSTSEPKVLPKQSFCGGFQNCATYFDGCNNCFCSDGLEGCTRMHCPAEALGTPQCLKCEFEYRFDENDDCVAKKVCEYTSDCDKANGFKCRKDPMCGGTIDYGEICVDPPKVCVDKEHVCKVDKDCDVENGFKCAGFNGAGNPICIEYE